MDRNGHQGLRRRAINLAAAAERLKRRSGPAGPAAPFALAFLTDRKRAPHPLLVARTLPAGSAIILRDYEAPRRAALAAQLQAVCARRGLMLLIGADIELASQIGAKGVHLPSWFRLQNDTSDNMPDNMIVSAACHNGHALNAAKALGAHIALLSPAFPTESHPEAPALGPAAFRKLAKSSPLPVLALGGVDERNADLLSGPNVAGIAGIGAFFRET